MNTAARTALWFAIAFSVAVLLLVLSAASASGGTPGYGFVAGHARALLEHDWDENTAATTPERMYRVTKDSTADWGGGVSVRYVLEVERVPAKSADPVSIRPAVSGWEPTVHTHGAFCTMTPWGVDYASCSWDRPESQQCFPSMQDRATQRHTGHSYDVVQCGRDQFVFFQPGGE